MQLAHMLHTATTLQGASSILCRSTQSNKSPPVCAFLALETPTTLGLTRFERLAITCFCYTCIKASLPRPITSTVQAQPPRAPLITHLRTTETTWLIFHHLRPYCNPKRRFHSWERLVIHRQRYVRHQITCLCDNTHLFPPGILGAQIP